MQQNQDDFEETLLNFKVREEIEHAARWAKLWAILSFITIFISLINSFLNLELINKGPQMEIFDTTSSWFMIVNAISLLLATALYIFLYLFGQTAKRSIENKDNQELNGAFKWLYRHFMLEGVIIILAVVSVIFMVFVAFNQY